MINSFKVFKLDERLDQKCFQNCNGINSGIILSFDQFLKHSKGFDHFEKSLEIDLKQTDFCARKSFDSFVFKGNGFDLSSYRHVLIIGDFFTSSFALDEFLIKRLLEQKPLRSETDFCDLDFCDFVLKTDLLSSETDKTWHLLRSFRNICVVLNCDNIVVYNTFFEKRLELLINVSQSEHTLLCSDVEKDMHVLGMIDIVACFDTILVYNVYFDVPLGMLKCSVSKKRKHCPCSSAEIWRFMNLRNGAVHGYRCDDPMSSERPRQLHWFRKKHDAKLLKPKNHFYFVHDERFSKLALSHSFPNSFTVLPDFEIRNPTFGNHFTCLMFVHVLDDYPKSSDPVFDDLRLEKPFDYFFRRFDVVSLVVLKVQDIKDQFQMEASRGGRHHTCVLGT
ncbi:hypothetical protein F2Q68_00004774 [Brassica cretica]|uniref:Uncharacterized protein n=1 Tax=Brassica cretica TaxID=69181 RepID=A0A8S9JHV9_BRACR|nr:hypothetical protein F2Q68_00004774 [Brassica cretica]